ncbi:MAG: response regulator [Phycisphaerae bacterium]|nr:response regulator [Phycisphaerae bacterium]
MKKRMALVVEDDERVLPSIEDALISLGHEHEVVTNQADAQQRIEEAAYDYVLLDLQIPARAGRGGASTEFGLNALRTIRQLKGSASPPVIIMTAHGSACVDLTNELTRCGATEFISKPFPERGRTLTSVIRGVLRSESGESMWLSVTQCAELICKDFPALGFVRAKARVSKAAGAGKFRTNGQKGATRRIEGASFNNWRLEQRDRDLDTEAVG